MAAYENTDNPIEQWSEDRLNKLTGDLAEINVLVKLDENFAPSNKFRSLFKMLLHDIATEGDTDEYEAAVVAAIQFLMEFGGGSLGKETIKDRAVFINEGWMFEYATSMKQVRK